MFIPSTAAIANIPWLSSFSQFRNHKEMRMDGSSWSSWRACLCFAFLSLFSWIIFIFVAKKRNRRAESAATSLEGAISQTTSIPNIDASSSSSVSVQLGYEYDVFLSFHGEDTRKGFTDSLHTALEGAGICVFQDSESLSVGKEISPELLHGIKQSSISIPIFSKNYASRKLCLKELAFMMECREARKQIVLPVFYDVTPNQVQHQTGSYARALQQHAKKQDHEIVQTWSKALTDVGWFGRGSRIILTTRNMNVLKVAHEHQIYELREMEKTQALQLFSKHALRKDAPAIKLRALSEEIVERTGALPLALEVIGSFLHGKSEDSWKAPSEKLKLVPNKEVEHKLRISYDA